MKEISNSHKAKEEECCCNNINKYTNGSKLTIRQFIKKYTDISSYRFDNKRGSNITPFGKISPIKSKLPNFDNKDNRSHDKIEKNESLETTLTTEQAVSNSETITITIQDEHEKNVNNSENEIALRTLTTSQQYMLSKIKAGLFTNHLISESDLLIEDYNYNHEIINDIDRVKGTDGWFCIKCTMKGDKWFMMKHPCKNKIIFQRIISFNIFQLCINTEYHFLL